MPNIDIRRGVAWGVGLAVQALPLLAQARPGGGSHYHSAAHSFSHSYSHSLSHSHGLVGLASSQLSPTQMLVLALIVLVVIAVVAVNQKRQAEERGEVGVDESAQSRGLAGLLAEDPAFDPAAFGTRAQTVMAKVNEAWCAGNMGPARRFISDGVYVRFQTQLALLEAGGLRNVMADWSLVGCEPLAAESDAHWDTMHMKMVAEARDVDVPAGLSLEQAAEKARHASLSRYGEVWSFLRRRGSKSKNGVPALEGHCPSCGAELPLSDVVRCQYCKAVVNSGEHDWVLAEITQPEEWRPSSASGEVPGLAALQAKDPALSRQELEDRASVVFWKWIDARVSGSRARLDRFCRVPGTPAADRAVLSQVAVGAADLDNVVVVSAAPGSALGSAIDRCDVEITFSASHDGHEPQNQVIHLLLGRDSGATFKSGLSSLTCPNCNGPLADSDTAKCSYCGAPLTASGNEWSLVAVG